MTGDSPSIDRRTALKVSGTALTSVGLASVVSADGRKLRLERIKGSMNDPITLAQIREAKTRLLEDFIDSGGDRPNPSISAEPEIPSDGPIVDYVVKMQSNGIPAQHIQSASDPTSEVLAHEAASDRKVELAEVEDPFKPRHTSWSRDWNYLSSDEWYWTKCPYGQVGNNFELWQVDESQDVYNRDEVGVQQSGIMTPGKNGNICGSDWHNEWMELDHWWWPAPDDDLIDWEPYDTNDSEIDVSLSASTDGTVTVNWDFDNDGCISHYANGSNSSVHWELNCLWDSSRAWQTQVVKPGSSCEMYACHDNTKVAKVRNRAHFEEDWSGDNYYLSLPWSLYHSHYC